MQRTLLVVLLTVVVLAGLYFVLTMNSSVVNEPEIQTVQNESENSNVQDGSVVEETPTPAMGKIDIKAVCEGALAYMSFTDGESADAFVAECIAGEHPEVIEQFKASLNLDAGVEI